MSINYNILWELNKPPKERLTAGYGLVNYVSWLVLCPPTQYLLVLSQEQLGLLSI
jgi:hypothetical protein